MNNLGRDTTPLSGKIRNTLFFVFLSTRGKLERKHSFLDSVATFGRQVRVHWDGCGGVPAGLTHSEPCIDPVNKNPPFSKSSQLSDVLTIGWKRVEIRKHCKSIMYVYKVSGSSGFNAYLV